MKKIVLLIVAALALVVDVSALDFNLFGFASDESSDNKVARVGSFRRSRRPVRVERESDDAANEARESEKSEKSSAALSDIAVEVEKVYVTNVVERVVERVVTNVVDRVVTNVVDRVVDRVVTNVVDRVVTTVVDRVVTNVVEKVVADKAEEERLERSNEDLSRRNAALQKENEKLEKAGGLRELENATLVENNDELKRRLADSEERNARLSRVVAPSALKQLTGRPAKISSRTTYYDRKEGFAVFTGAVHVDDEQYQMHADKAYVFFSGTNELKRLVAIGAVALTNGARRAYGGKASYHKDSGMVVLYSDKSGAPAEVRDESKVQDQVVKGERIKFWIDAEQVEVLDARISAPVDGGVGDLGELRAK